MTIKRVQPAEKKAPSKLRRAAKKPDKTQPVRRRSPQKWKHDERETSRAFQQIDGPTENAALKILQSSTGRLGHYNELRMDSASKHYAIEVKRRVLPVWQQGAWVLIQQKARDFNLHPVLVLCMTDKQGKYQHNGKEYPCEDIHGITASRHAHLLECERKVQELEQHG